MTDQSKRLRDARTYDGVAEVYERVSAPLLFEAPARALVAAAAPAPRARILDVGCGTGAVARAAKAAAGKDALVVAVDPSRDMLGAARRGGIQHVVAGSLPRLPFAGASFDVVLSAFVLTHVDDADGALIEIARVVRPGGTVGLSAWAAGDDAVTAAWSEVVEEYVDAATVSRAVDAVLPAEARFSKPTGLVDALRSNGFANVAAHDVDVSFRLSADEYAAGREAGASGRALRAVLSPQDWNRFGRHARRTLASRFPAGIAYSRRVYIATGRLPGP